MTNEEIIKKIKNKCNEERHFCSECPFGEYAGYDEDGNPDDVCMFELDIAPTGENEKTANELFKELGYKKESENGYSITYLRKLDYVATYIEFWINKKEIDFTNTSSITYDELQAINKKVEELQWK